MRPPAFAASTPAFALASHAWGALLDALSPKRKLLRGFRARWGAVGDKAGYLASRYFELTRGTACTAEVDDKTWADLEFPEIFARMDTTLTPVGSQVLFAQLRSYVGNPDLLARRCASYAALASDAPLRESIQLRLAGLKDDANADIAELLFAERPKRPDHGALIKGWSLASFHCCCSGWWRHWDGRHGSGLR